MKKSFLLCLAIPFFTSGLKAQDITDTIEIGEVTITGSKVEISRKNMPVNVYILDKRDINEVEESSVLPVLSRKIPGIFVTERGITGFGIGASSAGQVMVRGVGGSPNTQVLMLVDGHPQYMGIFGHPFPNSYVASDLERVEVIKGPGSILYGSNAMGGVINFITKKQMKDGFSGNARMAYGSYNTQKYMFNGGFRHKGLNVFASVNRDVTDGHRDSSEFEINNAYVKAGYDINSHLEVIVDYSIAKLKNSDPGMDFLPSTFKADITRGKTSFAIKNKFERLEGGIYSFYNFGEHVLSDGWISNDENFGVSVYEGLTLPWNTLLTVGADFKRFGGRGNMGAAANTWNVIDEKAIYTIVRHELLKVLNLSYGLRLENNSKYGNELIPQGGISWNASDETTLKASVSKGFRSPTIMETFLFLQNPLLEPERMMNYELNLGQSLLKGNLRTEISIFMLKGSNMIQVIPNDAPPPPVKRSNVGEFTNKGFEIGLHYSRSKNLSSDLSYSYLNTEEPLLAAPAHQVYAGMNYTWNKFSFSLQEHFIGGLYSYIHSQTETSADDIIENYFILNAGINYKPVKFVEIFISGKNLLDQKYQINNGYPMPGINFMAGVGVSFK